jgi:hypothetical protein
MKIALLLDFGGSCIKEMNNIRKQDILHSCTVVFLNILCVPRLINGLIHDNSAKSKKGVHASLVPRLSSANRAWERKNSLLPF